MGGGAQPRQQPLQQRLGILPEKLAIIVEWKNVTFKAISEMWRLRRNRSRERNWTLIIHSVLKTEDVYFSGGTSADLRQKKHAHFENHKKKQ